MLQQVSGFDDTSSQPVSSNSRTKLQPSMRFLLVEDDPLHVEVCLAMLRSEQRHIITVTDSVEKARHELVHGGQFDCILLDLKLPDGHGTELLPLCVQFHPQTPVIMLTATDRLETALQTVGLGAEDYLVKGEYNQKMLLRSISYARERRRWQREQMLLNQKLEFEQQANQRHRDFVALMAHEFRTPVAVIDSSVQLIERCPSGMEACAAQIKAIAHACTRLKRLIATSFSFLQMESGNITAARKPVDVMRTVGEVIESTHILCPARVIIQTGDAPTASWLGDAALLEQMLFNLIQNAVKFSSPDSQITVEVDAKQNGIFVRVIDQGIGIPAPEIGKIGAYFFRASNANQTGGTGIGLYLVRSMAERMGASFAIRSQQGQGTIASLWLPLAADIFSTGAHA